MKKSCVNVIQTNQELKQEQGCYRQTKQTNSMYKTVPVQNYIDVKHINQPYGQRFDDVMGRWDDKTIELEIITTEM